MTSYIDLREKVQGGFPDMGVACNAQSYAERLARYIGDASTIRARTFNEYGRAPTIDAIRAMQRRARGEAEFIRLVATADTPDVSEDPQMWRQPGYARMARERRETIQAAADRRAGRHIAARAEQVASSGNDVVTIRDIISEVGRAFDMSYDDVVRRTNARAVVRVRHFAMWVLKQRGRISMAQIGRVMGGRDHSTVIHGIKMFEKNATPELRYMGMTIARMGMVPVDDEPVQAIGHERMPLMVLQPRAGGTEAG